MNFLKKKKNFERILDRWYTSRGHSRTDFFHVMLFLGMVKKKKISFKTMAKFYE